MGGQSGDTRYWSLGYRPSPPPHIRHGTTYHHAREQITETGLVPDHSRLYTTTYIQKQTMTSRRAVSCMMEALKNRTGLISDDSVPNTNS